MRRVKKTVRETVFSGARIEGVGREEEEFCTGGPDGFANSGGLVAAEVVQNDNVVLAQGRDQNLFDIGPEYLAVDPSPWSLGPVAFPWLDVDDPGVP